MSGNNEKVLLDLNYSEFQSALFDLDTSDIKKVFKTLKKVKNMTWQEVFQDHGLKWEELKSVAGKFTIRLSQSYRAVVARDGSFMRFLVLSQDHNAAYGKK